MSIFLFILGIIIGSLITLAIPIVRKKYAKLQLRYRRTGILYNSIKKIGDRDLTSPIGYQLEVGEVERTNEKSKIYIINITIFHGVYNISHYKGQIRDMWHNTWIESNSVEWIVSPVEDKREDKINQILK